MSKDLGDRAETAVSSYLEKQGYTILNRNWRTRWCEIDIIAAKAGVVHFVEVKFRSHENQGGGFDYITPKKLKQMQFAAEFWLAHNDFEGEAVLSAAAVDSFYTVDFIEDVS